jgi:hypothetical protein
MRIPNPRLIRLASLVRGGILEEGDGELVIPGLLQPVTSLASPINTVTTATPATLIDDSFYNWQQVSKVGIQVAATLTMVSMTKGMWEFEITSAFNFSGTSAPSNSAYLLIQDPDSTQAPMVLFQILNGFQQQYFSRFRMIFQRDNFLFAIATPPTVGGDNLFIGFGINARRLL